VAQTSILFSQPREIIAAAKTKAAQLGVPVNIAVLTAGRICWP
jgi:hypothetical protein